MVIGIDVNAELNDKLWRPVGVAMQSYPAPVQQSMKRKSSAVSSTVYHSPRASEITSPISTASESTVPTPPPPPAPTASAIRPHKRSKISNVNGNGRKQIPLSHSPGKYPFLIFIFKRTLVLD